MTGFFDEEKRRETWSKQPQRERERRLAEEEARAPDGFRYYMELLLKDIKEAYEAGLEEFAITSKYTAAVEERFGNGAIRLCGADNVIPEMRG
jgi:hypothetical protein